MGWCVFLFLSLFLSKLAGDVELVVLQIHCGAQWRRADCVSLKGIL